MINRRQLLKIGGASLLVTGVGAGAFVGTRRPNSALTPWLSESHAFEDPRIRALSYGLLAPNPHNRQPWVAELSTDNSVTLYCDLDRRLPETDPYDRQITIGLGCFIELTRMAAEADGFKVKIEVFPDGAPPEHERLDTRAVARLVFERGSPRVDPLFAMVPKRRSNKEPYDKARPLPHETVEAITVASGMKKNTHYTLDASMVNALRALSWDAYKVEVLTPRTLQESIDLMRIGKLEIEANPDGIPLGGATIEIASALSILNRESLADVQSKAFQQGLQMYFDMLHSAMGYVWIETPDNSRFSQLEAGAAWVRMNLKATELGVGMHPLSQALQEYSEMDRHYAHLHEKLAVDDPSRIQMFGRLGYGPETDPSPRWPIETRIIEA